MAVGALCDGEALEGLGGVLVYSLEPALVSDLDLEDVEVAVAHGGLEEVVATSLVTVSCERGKM